MNCTISYNGKVSIQVKNKPRRVLTNSGTPELFNLLCRILAQQLTPYSDRKFAGELPALIDVLCCPNTTDSQLFLDYPQYKEYSQYSILTQKAAIYSREVNNSVLKLTTILNNSIMSSSYETNLNNASLKTYIVLLDGNAKNILAVILVDSSFKESLKSVGDDVNSQATITWEMSFTNSYVEVNN